MRELLIYGSLPLLGVVLGWPLNQVIQHGIQRYAFAALSITAQKEQPHDVKHHAVA